MTEAAAIPGTRSWARLDGIDMLRSLAILFVLLNHVNMRLLIARVPYTQGLPAQLVASLVWNAQHGVQIFFAVSGFLITSTTLRRWQLLAGVRIRDFYGLRFARIAPLLVLLLAVLSALHAAHLRDFVVSARTGGLRQALFAALTFHVNVLEARRGYLPGNWDILWSLSVEEVFYVFFPIVCRILGRGRLLVGLLLVFVALGPVGRTVFAHGNEVWHEYSYLGGMDAIALGCLTAILLSQIRLSRYVSRLLGSVGAAVMVFILGFSIRANDLGLGHAGLDMTVLAIGTCMVIAAAAETRWRGPRALLPFLMFGQRSYEIYLTHMFVVFACFDVFVAISKPIGAVPILFIVVVLAAGLLGELVARFYSEPLNRLLRARFREGRSELGAIIEARSAV